ncbi:MAG: hypothetical protein LUH22_04640 [Bacteroides sp.]|nr:hypothetical protein [Bacteroides sp.]
MINIHTKYFKIIGIYYLCIPIILFLLGWINYFISIPLSVAILYLSGKIYKNFDDHILPVSRKNLIFIFSTIFIWVFLSGIGRFVWQNLDHLWRNAIFNDLILKDWPVSENSYTLCYYIGYWLPAALIGKFFNSVFIGDCFLLIWTFIGISLFYFLISEYLKKIKLGVLFVVIFFSGLDIIVYVIVFLSKNNDILQLVYDLKQFPHIEWIGFFQASSITTLLFWVFNQAVPFFVGMMLILLNRDKLSFLLFIYSMLLIYSPFPFIGFAPVMIYFYLKQMRDKGIKIFFIKFINLPNFIGLLLMLIVGFYYLSNVASESSGIKLPDIRYLYFVLSQYIIFIIFLPRQIWKDPIFVILFITAIIFPLIRVGIYADFGMRTNIPFIIYLIILLCKELYSSRTSNKIRKMIFTILVIGAITPLFEMGRTISNSFKCFINGVHLEQRLNDSDSIFDKELIGGNFLGRKDSFFNKYLLKK